MQPYIVTLTNGQRIQVSATSAEQAIKKCFPFREVDIETVVPGRI